MLRRLGKNQLGMLERIRHYGYWTFRSGWTYGTKTQTRAIVDQLFARGMVTMECEPGEIVPRRYVLTDFGRSTLEESNG